MKLTLRLLGKDETYTKTLVEQSHELEVSEAEYDFITRILQVNADVRNNPMMYLEKHAPQLADKIIKRSENVFYMTHDDDFIFDCLWSEQTLKDTDFKQNELKNDEECELLMVKLPSGEVVTEKNIIGCHFRRDFVYETCPGEASGITNRKGFDMIDCDIFGCDLEYWNIEAQKAKNKFAEYEFKGATLSVEYLNESNVYKTPTIIVKSTFGDSDIERLAKVMQHSLRVIRKKIERRELKRII